jgi:hypothetical protein
MHVKYFLIIAILACVLVSCKKDDKAASPAVTIVGKWYLKKYHTRSYKNNVLLRDTARTDYSVTDFEVFSNDGSGYTSNLTPSGETALIIYQYTLNGKVLTISKTTPAFYEGTYTINTLTENALEVSYESRVTINGDHYYGIDNISFAKE